MRKIAFLLIALQLVVLGACERNDSTVANGAGAQIAQSDIDSLAKELQVRFRLLSSKQEGGCNEELKGKACFTTEIIFNSNKKISQQGWEIYFSNIFSINKAESLDFSVEHINGDLYRLTPTGQFKGFAPGKDYRVALHNEEISVFQAKYMPNYYVVADGLQPRIIESTRFGIDSETGFEIRPHILPTVDDALKESQFPVAGSFDLYQSNLAFSGKVLDVGLGVIPKPQKVEAIPNVQPVSINQGFKLSLNNISQNAVTAALERLSRFGFQQKEGGVDLSVSVFADAAKKPESYDLTITDKKILILAQDEAGAFYALQTLAALIQLGNDSLPAVKIKDSPRYAFRGQHIDVARNFHSKELLLDVLDQMAAYKLNKLHLHLGDDEGWRLEVNGLPELTDIASKRCHDLEEKSCLIPQLGSGPFSDTPVNGYYSIDDYKEILRAASARHIQVIPSFDMPGHARAAVKAMEARYQHFMEQGDADKAEQYLLSDLDDATVYKSIQYYTDNTINVCRESTYEFIAKVIDETKAVHQAAGHPLTRYHIGADETAGAWKESPICKRFLQGNQLGIKDTEHLNGYFIQRVAGLLLDKGIEVAAWGDGLSKTDPAAMPKIVQTNAWDVLHHAGHVNVHKQLNLGWQVVLSIPDALYFDFPYEPHPLAHGQYWAVPSVNTRKVFQFMPDNLPAHAEVWSNGLGKPFVSRDKVEKGEDGVLKHRPIKVGYRYLGMQGHIWTELVRNEALFEHMLFPRMLAMAERAWHQGDWELPYDHKGREYSRESGYFTADHEKLRDEDWLRFANILVQKELPKLDLANIQYRVPMAGAVVRNGMLSANLILPGLGIEYRLNQGPWKTYSAEVKLDSDGEVEIRAIAADGKRRGRSLPVAVSK